MGAFECKEPGHSEIISVASLIFILLRKLLFRHGIDSRRIAMGKRQRGESAVSPSSTGERSGGSAKAPAPVFDGEATARGERSLPDIDGGTRHAGGARKLPPEAQRRSGLAMGKRQRGEHGRLPMAHERLDA